MITQQQIHYFKANIRQFKEAPRIKVNMDIVNREGKLAKFTWRLTQERRELHNSLDGAEDQGWNTYDEYIALWKEIRSEKGQGVKLWTGKLAHRTRWGRGAQPLERVPFAVALLVLDRRTDDLLFQFSIDTWRQDFELQTIQGAEYNRVYTWQNPQTQILGPSTRRLF
tara:strand:- start:884 stop:1387 length:504 start_codon:yes stop_codon:yes gene_type:complete